MGRPATDTKQKLIDTALELMWVSSYGSVSVDDICKKADVKKGSFYHYFPSKVELTLAAMEEYLQKPKALMDQVFSPSKDPIERFQTLADVIYEDQLEVQKKYGKICGCPCTAIGSELACQEERIRDKFEEFMAYKAKYYENAIRDMVAMKYLPADTHVKNKAQEVFTFIFGQVMLARIQNDLEALKRDLKPGILRTLGVTEKVKESA